MSIFNKFNSFEIWKEFNFKKFPYRKSIPIFGYKEGKCIGILMYLSKPKWITNEEFKELVENIKVSFEYELK